MDLRKFRDLMASEELYFRRAELYPDKSEVSHLSTMLYVYSDLTPTS